MSYSSPPAQHTTMWLVCHGGRPGAITVVKNVANLERAQKCGQFGKGMCIILAWAHRNLALALLQYTGERMTQPPGSFFLMSSGAHVTKPWFMNKLEIYSRMIYTPG